MSTKPKITVCMFQDGFAIWADEKNIFSHSMCSQNEADCRGKYKYTEWDPTTISDVLLDSRKRRSTPYLLKWYKENFNDASSADKHRAVYDKQ